MKIYLRDTDRDVVREWRNIFLDGPCNISQGNIFDIPAQCIVSPANSFGFMNGGIDAAYTKYFGKQLQDRLQKDICDLWYGEIPVGQAHIIPTNNTRYPYLISAPTMRVPEDVSNTVNAYLAFRAVLLIAVRNHIDSIICPGLGTLTGKISPESCAIQMYNAYDLIMCRDTKTHRYSSLARAIEDHSNMKG